MLFRSIMLAPKSGKEIRKDIKHGAEMGAKKASKAVHDAAKFVKEEAASVNDTVAEKVNDIKTHFKHAKESPIDSAEILEEEIKSSL